jgi:hypothetical protein
MAIIEYTFMVLRATMARNPKTKYCPQEYCA